MNSIRCSQCEHYIEANAGEGKIYGCDRSRCVFEPTTKNDLEVDCISRADAIQAMQDKAKKLTNEDTINGLCGAVAILYEMPSVTPQPCDDAVSRKDVVKILGRIEQKVFDGEGFDYEESRAMIDELPSVTPQTRKGHWIIQWNLAHQKEYYYCSECREEYSYDGETGIKMNDYNFCPNCGADMREVEE